MARRRMSLPRPYFSSAASLLLDLDPAKYIQKEVAKLTSLYTWPYWTHLGNQRQRHAIHRNKKRQKISKAAT